MKPIVAFFLISFAASAQTGGIANGPAVEYKSIQPGKGAILRSQQDINRDHGADVKDFGALCDGKTDDTEAIQTALNATPGNGKLTISGPQPCVISHMVYIPVTAAGMILESTRAAPGIGLIAKSGVAPFQMLRTYAAQLHIRDLYLDCHATASTGLVVADSSQSVIDNVISTHCTGDANQLNPYADPASVTSSDLPAGSRPGTQLTVASAELAGLTLGGANCLAVMLDYGKPNQESFEFTRSGNTLKQLLPSKSVYAHAAGATIQCNGNNNAVILNNLEGLYSGGWGLDMLEGTDNNAVTIRDPTMFGNKTGGEILSGSVGRHIGGHMEGNRGPAVQLGDLQGGGPNGINGRVTFGWTIDPINDLENSEPSYNGIAAVCDGFSHVQFKSPAELSFSGPGGPFCPTFRAGVSTLGTGYDRNANGSPRLAIKILSGVTVIDPALGVGFYDASGKLENIFGPVNAAIAGQLTFGPDLRIIGNELSLQVGSPDGEIALNRAGKPNALVTLYNGAAVPEVTLNPKGNSSFIGIQAKGLAGSGNRPACIDAAGNLYAGNNSNGVLTCP